jgi:hypothetical protein
MSDEARSVSSSVRIDPCILYRVEYKVHGGGMIGSRFPVRNVVAFMRLNSGCDWSPKCCSYIQISAEGQLNLRPDGAQRLEPDTDRNNEQEYLVWFWIWR